MSGSGGLSAACDRHRPTGLLGHLAPPPFTGLAAFAMLALFAAVSLTGGDAATNVCFKAGEFSTDRFVAGEWWRLLTSPWVHCDLQHMLGNCTVLMLVGFALERRLGTLRTMFIYFAGAAAGDAILLAIHKHGGGASAAIIALVGAVLVRPPRQWNSVARSAAGVSWGCAAWLCYSVLTSGADSLGIAHEAHFAGLIVGLCLGAALSDRGAPGPVAWPRSVRLAAAAIVSLGLILGQAPLARWNLDWHRGAAMRAERHGDLAGASADWMAIENTADSRDCLEAVFIENAARYRLRRHDYIGARRLLIAVAPTLQDAKVFRDAGFLLAQHEPKDPILAQRFLRRAAWSDPNMPDVLNAVAWSIVAADTDSTAGEFTQALEMAKRAVAIDKARTPEFMATLAWAEYRCGETSSAVYWMQRAIARNPSDRAAFVADLETFEQE